VTKEAFFTPDPVDNVMKRSKLRMRKPPKEQK
jgi:hypothetical protein